MIHEDNYRAWAEISVGALRDNFRLARRLTNGCKIMPVIKGDAHGHGAVAYAKVFQQEGAEAFAVACILEAIELRQAGITVPLLILGYTETCAVEELLQYDLIQSAFSVDYARELSDEAVRCGGVLKVHAKLDTGMTRTGIFAQHDPDAAADEVLAIDAMPGLGSILIK